MILLLLAACGLPGNDMQALDGAPFGLGPVRTALWGASTAEGAALALSAQEFGCEELASAPAGGPLKEGPTVTVWFAPVEPGAFEGTYRSGMYGWGDVWPGAETAPTSTFWSSVWVDGEAFDDSGVVGVAEVTHLDADRAEGWITTQTYEARFEAELCPAMAGDDCTPTDELCNGLDDDCDGEIDEGLERTVYRDEDGDGHGGPDATVSCEDGEGWVEIGDDCNDDDPTMYPGAEEACDEIDNDCDAYVDEQAC